MDVIVEGQINAEETISDVIATINGIKTCQTPILRLNDNKSDLQGRVLFSQPGFILGGKLALTDESGWDAVRKLLMITDGNYAILDPLRKQTGDLNQALWIATDKLVAALPNLPKTDETLADKAPERISGSAVRPHSGQKDLAPAMAMAGAPKDDGGADSVLKGRITGEHRQITHTKAPSRKYNESRWRMMKFIMQMTFGLGLCFLMMTNSEAMWDMTVKISKAFGAGDPMNNPMFVNFQKSMVDVISQKAKKPAKNSRSGSHR